MLHRSTVQMGPIVSFVMALLIVLGLATIPARADANSDPVAEAQRRVAEVVELSDALAIGRIPALTEERRSHWARWILNRYRDAGSRQNAAMLWLWATSTGETALARALDRHLDGALTEGHPQRCAGDGSGEAENSSQNAALSEHCEAPGYRPFDDRLPALDPLSAAERPASQLTPKRDSFSYQPFDDGWPSPSEGPPEKATTAEARCSSSWVKLVWTPGQCVLARRYDVFDDQPLESVEQRVPTVSTLFHPIDGVVRDARLRIGDSSWTLVSPRSVYGSHRVLGTMYLTVASVADASSAFDAGPSERVVIGVVTRGLDAGRALGEDILRRECLSGDTCVARIVDLGSMIVVLVHVRPNGRPAALPVAGWAYLLETSGP